MNMNVLTKSLVAFGVAILCSPAAHATSITVQDLGSILNDSVSFPSTKTPGSGQTFDDFFEFTLPTAEYITASMSISGPIVDQIPSGKGQLSLFTWTSTSSSSPFIPLGTLIEEATVSDPSKGGQSAVVGTFTPFGDYEAAGTYFVEVAGTSGAGSLQTCYRWQRDHAFGSRAFDLGDVRHRLPWSRGGWPEAAPQRP